MPTYRSINIALHSQFDVQTLPEYHPLSEDRYITYGATEAVPKYIDETTSTCSVYIPVLPGSTFWIGYSVSPPVPDGHYFLFKLYITNTHIISWSTGKEDGWKGKTMFGLYDRPGDDDGKGRVEKRVLAFTSPSEKNKVWNDMKDLFDGRLCMEIRVHRAHGRKRVEREIKQYKETQHAKLVEGINLVNAGRASSEQPKRFYKFALSDPVDQPFATFKYFYRTWEQLHNLGLLEEKDESTALEDDLPVIEPSGESVASSSRATNPDVEDVFHECGDDAADAKGHIQSPCGDGEQKVPGTAKARKPSMSNTSQRTSTPEQPRAYIPRGAPNSRDDISDDQTDEHSRQHHGDVCTPLPRSYRLSVPPSVRFAPPPQQTGPLRTVHVRSDSSSSTAYRPHPAYPVDEWRTRTPSPVKSIRDGITTPPMEQRKEKGIGASSLMNAISSTWKRRGTSSSESHSTARSAT